jgi:amidase
MQDAMVRGQVSSRALVQQSLVRIALYEDRLNAIVTVNPRALDEADQRDRERASGRVRGPLHGIPIALKDNIHTADLRTTGGALAFADLLPPYDATITRQLREAGAVIVAKTQLTELANWVTVGMPGNYNSLTGYGFNPYDPRRDPRPATADGRPALNTGGSSSGAGTAVSFWAANVGTETSGSILTPSNQLMLAGIKPTVGRISRYGVIPRSTTNRRRRPAPPFPPAASLPNSDPRWRKRSRSSRPAAPPSSTPPTSPASSTPIPSVTSWHGRSAPASTMPGARMPAARWCSSTG